MGRDQKSDRGFTHSQVFKLSTRSSPVTYFVMLPSDTICKIPKKQKHINLRSWEKVNGNDVFGKNNSRKSNKTLKTIPMQIIKIRGIIIYLTI